MISTARRILQGCRAPPDPSKVHFEWRARVPKVVNHQLRHTPTRVALYARCSTLDQHPEAQIEQLRLLAQQRGWDIVGEYVDHGQSGRRDRRPELDRLMGDVLRGRVHAVAVVRFDRWARSVRHLVQTLDDFRCRNVDFISLSDGIDTSTPAGRFCFHVVAAVAQLEADLCRDRTIQGLIAARRRGARVGRPPVYVDVVRARRLQRAGMSIRKIAAELGVGASTLHRALAVPESGVAAPAQTGELTGSP
jgi:DNA invertase Pin-like site-specific DNA recombinase